MIRPKFHPEDEVKWFNLTDGNLYPSKSNNFDENYNLGEGAQSKSAVYRKRSAAIRYELKGNMPHNKSVILNYGNSPRLKIYNGFATR
jgi:hypothetical protein